MKLIERIGQNGMSNTNYLLFGKYVLRIPFAQYNGIVDRQSERIAKLLAKECPIAKFQKVMLPNGVALRRYFDCTPLDTVESITDWQIMSVGMCMEMLHSVSPDVVKKLVHNKHMDVFARIERIINSVQKKNYAYHWHIDTFNKIKDKIEEAGTSEYVLCHGDMMPSNILYGEYGTIAFIDFEFACICDPIYDIACFGNINDNDGLRLLDDRYRYAQGTKEYKGFLARYYMWRFVQVYQWFNVASYKANQSNNEEQRKFFESYANTCVTKLSDYFNKLKEMEVV